MAIVDVHSELNAFYEDWVRLGKDGRKRLEAARNVCLDRLVRGMEELGDDRGQAFQSFETYVEQGSFAMGTLNQHPRGESDIDVAVIFRKDDLPTTALAARKRVADALLIAGGNFVRPPEPRTNAVTVWYADGAHVDFAVYRKVERLFGTELQHAGPDWRVLDPTSVTGWFAKKVDELSPELFLNVGEHQFRRVVQWVKMFARSRAQWDLPGGMILTALLAETYEPHRKRDDVSLYMTLQAVAKRLDWSLAVTNPIDRSHELTGKPTRMAQMKDLQALLSNALGKLAVIGERDCTRKDALRAWGKFFNHRYWGECATSELEQRA